jgi:hypothetical protein
LGLAIGRAGEIPAGVLFGQPVIVIASVAKQSRGDTRRRERFLDCFVALLASRNDVADKNIMPGTGPGMKSESESRGPVATPAEPRFRYLRTVR